MSQAFQLIDGIKCYAPALAAENDGFFAESFQLLYEVEDRNFWFVARNQVIQHLFGKYVGTGAASVLEIGCGTGYVLAGLEKRFPKYQLKGSEIHLEGIRFAQKRLPSVAFIQLDATSMPFEDAFEAVGAFDVLEHISDDEQVLREIFKSLKRGGHLVLSVPQYQFMWSVADDIAFHKRRYHRKELHRKLTQAGFEVKYLSAFVFTLFPLMYFSRIVRGKYRHRALSKDEILQLSMQELRLHPLLNRVFSGLMRLDIGLIRLGISLPWGGSLIAVAKKR
ncbi:class I SAM-dependent methyltransferase [Eisenibacter elegans]|jgi:SAM-dependent methyltransferase|uniref:class I SAM-dependent methyltransferase n=1 Tax=Eisenibacter elegans TaxID=997 RepID=UPI0004088B7C|nr:class I SAM-dependent methyltransferase [Eisenibacter elegans]